MAGILLDLLASTAAGQLTRAEAFLRRFRTYEPSARLVIVKDRDALTFADGSADWVVKNVSIGSGRLRVFRRMAWENFALPHLMRRENLNVYLTFSHYLPILDGHSGVHSIVGVSNLAPFSAEAWQVESNASRLRLWLLRHSIISSAKRADQVIALSRTCRRILTEQGVDASKIEVIPNGVEPFHEETNRARSRDSWPRDSYILAVSHFYRYKNFERLIEAYSLLPQSLKTVFKLVIIGKPVDAAYFNEIRRLITRLGVDERVEVIPGADRGRLDGFYRNASLFVFTSLIENSPNILLEAMSNGLPILAGNIEPMPEFGSDGVRYYDVRSTQDLMNKMEALLRDRDSAADLGARARMRAGDFSWDAFTRNVVHLCSRGSGALAVT